MPVALRACSSGSPLASNTESDAESTAEREILGWETRRTRALARACELGRGVRRRGLGRARTLGGRSLRAKTVFSFCVVARATRRHLHRRGGARVARTRRMLCIVAKKFVFDYAARCTSEAARDIEHARLLEMKGRRVAARGAAAWSPRHERAIPRCWRTGYREAAAQRSTWCAYGPRARDAVLTKSKINESASNP